MSIKQLSVFAENKPGAVAQITDVLSENSIDMRAMNIADTQDFGILRMIVSDTEKARLALKESRCVVSVTDVVCVEMPDRPGALGNIIKLLAENSVNIEYMYAFANGVDAAAVLKSDDPGRVIDILKGSGFDVYSADEAYHATDS